MQNVDPLEYRLPRRGEGGYGLKKNISLKSFKDISEYIIENMRLQVGAYLGQT